jgi:hypothetical protein
VQECFQHRVRVFHLQADVLGGELVGQIDQAIHRWSTTMPLRSRNALMIASSRSRTTRLRLELALDAIGQWLGGREEEAAPRVVLGLGDRSRR